MFVPPATRQPHERLLSVLTPVAPERSEHIRETANSIDQSRRAINELGWKLEWLITVDGLGRLPTIDAEHKLISLNRNFGISTARNVALSQAQGDWVMPLDADDLFCPDELRALLTNISDDDHWIASNRLLLDGSKTPHWNDKGRGWSVGELVEGWTTPFSFHPNSLTVRRNDALLVGGWPAIPMNEDLGFVVALSERFPGRFDVSHVVSYRVWDGQEVNNPSYINWKSISYKTIEGQVNAYRASQNRVLVTAPPPGRAFGREARDDGMTKK